MAAKKHKNKSAANPQKQVPAARKNKKTFISPDSDLYKFNDYIKKNSNIISWFIVGVICIIYILRTNGVFFFEGGDNAYYILLAKALAAGQGYRDTFLNGAPPHTQYPPLFPILLSLVIRLKGVDIYWIKMIVSLGGAAAIALTFALLRIRSFTWALIAVIWAGCSYRIFSYADAILTEPLFMAFAAGALLAYEKWRRTDKYHYAVLMALACWAAQLTRTAALPLVIALAVATFLRIGRNKRGVVTASVVFAVCLAPMILWGVREHHMAAKMAVKKAGYLSQLLAVDPYDPTKGQVGIGDLIARFIDGIHIYAVDTLGLIQADKDFLFGHGAWFFIAVFWGLAVIGFIYKLRRDKGVTEIYFILFLGMVYIWPFQNFRFMLPIYPFLIAYIIEGGAYVIRKWLSKNEYLKLFLAPFLILSLVATIYYNIYRCVAYNFGVAEWFARSKMAMTDNIYALPWGEFHGRLLEASIWVAKNTDPKAIVVSRKPSLAAFASGHVIEQCPLVPPDNPKAWLKEKGVSYLIVDELFPNSLQLYSKMTNGAETAPGLTIRFKNENTFVVEITPAYLGN